MTTASDLVTAILAAEHARDRAPGPEGCLTLLRAARGLNRAYRAASDDLGREETVRIAGLATAVYRARCGRVGAEEFPHRHAVVVV